MPWDGTELCGGRADRGLENPVRIAGSNESILPAGWSPDGALLCEDRSGWWSVPGAWRQYRGRKLREPIASAEFGSPASCLMGDVAAASDRKMVVTYAPRPLRWP